jgi:hypothetical protein
MARGLIGTVFKLWLLKKFGARAGVGCLGMLVFLVVIAMLIGYLIRQ